MNCLQKLSIRSVSIMLRGWSKVTALVPVRTPGAFRAFTQSSSEPLKMSLSLWYGVSYLERNVNTWTVRYSETARPMLDSLTSKTLSLDAECAQRESGGEGPGRRLCHPPGGTGCSGQLILQNPAADEEVCAH